MTECTGIITAALLVARFSAKSLLQGRAELGGRQVGLGGVPNVGACRGGAGGYLPPEGDVGVDRIEPLADALQGGSPSAAEELPEMSHVASPVCVASPLHGPPPSSPSRPPPPTLSPGTVRKALPRARAACWWRGKWRHQEPSRSALGGRVRGCRAMDAGGAAAWGGVG